MIVFRITMNAIPGKQQEVMQTLLPMIEPTTEKVGCLSFNIFCDLKDKNRFCLLGEWKKRNDLDQYLTSQQFSVLMGTNALLCEPIEIKIHTVSHSDGIDAIHRIRNLKRSSKFPTDGRKRLDE